MGKDQPKTEKKAAIKQVDEIVEGIVLEFEPQIQFGNTIWNFPGLRRVKFSFLK